MARNVLNLNDCILQETDFGAIHIPLRQNRRYLVVFSQRISFRIVFRGKGILLEFCCSLHRLVVMLRG